MKVEIYGKEIKLSQFLKNLIYVELEEWQSIF